MKKILEALKCVGLCLLFILGMLIFGLVFAAALKGVSVFLFGGDL